MKRIGLEGMGLQQFDVSQRYPQVGIDVIGGYLTEINVTSPTGIQEINRFDGVKLEAWIWDVIEAKVK